MPLVSGQAAAQSTVQEIAAWNVVFDTESGLLSVDVGAVPVADVLQSHGQTAKIRATYGLGESIVPLTMGLEDNCHEFLGHPGNVGSVSLRRWSY